MCDFYIVAKYCGQKDCLFMPLALMEDKFMFEKNNKGAFFLIEFLKKNYK